MSKVLEGLVENKTLSILKTLSKNTDKIFHLNSLSTQSKVPISSTFRIVKKLKKNGFIDEIKVGKSKLYLFAKNKKSDQIKKIILNSTDEK